MCISEGERAAGDPGGVAAAAGIYQKVGWEAILGEPTKTPVWDACLAPNELTRKEKIFKFC